MLRGPNPEEFTVPSGILPQLPGPGMVSGRSNQVRTVSAGRLERLELQFFQMQPVYTAPVPPGWLLKHSTRCFTLHQPLVPRSFPGGAAG